MGLSSETSELNSHSVGLSVHCAGAASASDFPDLIDFTGSPPQQRTKWLTKTIQVSVSTSLSSPTSAITPDSDIAGAVHRALSRWSTAANIRFEEVSSKVQSISPVNGGDGISLITIAETAENLAIFGRGHNPGRTRVFFDPETGEIVEADIAINPQPTGVDGTPLQFSTDGTPRTYDLESTLMHEIGHFLESGSFKRDWLDHAGPSRFEWNL